MKTLKHIDNIDKGRNILVIVVVALMCIALVSVIIFYNNRLEAANSRVYVLVNGNSLELALGKDATVNRKVEAINHIEMAHKFFFNLDPDPVDIKKSIERALYLGDNTLQELYSRRNEELYYHKLVEGNISSRILIDSIKVDMSVKPFNAAIYAKQKLTRPTKIIEKNLIASCRLRETKRTDKNPHGFMIERYRIVNSDILSQKNR